MVEEGELQSGDAPHKHRPMPLQQTPLSANRGLIEATYIAPLSRHRNQQIEFLHHSARNLAV